MLFRKSANPTGRTLKGDHGGLASGEGPNVLKVSKLRIKVLGKGGGEQRESLDEQHLVFVCCLLLKIANQI